MEEWQKRGLFQNNKIKNSSARAMERNGEKNVAAAWEMKVLPFIYHACTLLLMME
jgi:predicted lipoprotein